MALLAFGSQIKEINGRLLNEAIKNESSNNLELKKDFQNGFILIDLKEGNWVSPKGKTKLKHQQKTDSQIEKAIQQLPKPQFISLPLYKLYELMCNMGKNNFLTSQKYLKE